MPISDMTSTEYLIAFSDCRTALSDTYIRQASESGRLYCAKENETYLGYICTAFGNGTEQILYAFTPNAYRGRGVFTSLAEHIVRTANVDVRASVHEKNPYFAIVEHIFRRIGFEETECIHVYTLDRESKEAWERWKARQHYDMCRTYLRRFGYETVSFAEADDDLIRQIETSPETSFGNPFHPADYFRHPSKNLARAFSFAATRNGELAAYVLVSQPSADALLVEHMVTSMQTRDSGVLLLPLVCVTDCFFASDMHRLSFSIHPSNRESNRVRETMEKELTFTDTVTHNFTRQKEREKQE